MYKSVEQSETFHFLKTIIVTSPGPSRVPLHNISIRGVSLGPNYSPKTIQLCLFGSSHHEWGTQGKGEPSVWVLNSVIFFWWYLWKEHWHGLCLSFNIIVGKTNALSQVIKRSQIECWNIEEAFLRFVFLASRKQIPPGLHYAWGLCKVTKYIVVANT